MKKLIIILVILPVFIACSNKEDIIPNPIQENEYFTGIDLSKSYTLTNPLPTFENEKFHALGYGYDITGKYAHPDWIRNKVIDSQKFEDDYYYDVYKWRKFSHRGLGTITGSKERVKDQLIKKFNLKDISSDHKNAFNGIFETPFENDQTFPDLEYFFAVNAFASSWYEHYFDLYRAEDIQRLKDYITDDFKSDIESKTVDEIIKLYGTHVMVDIEVGWRQDYYYRSSSSSDLEMRMIYASAKFLGSTPGVWVSPEPEPYFAKENLYSEYVSGVSPQHEAVAWMFDITNYSEKLLFEQRAQNIDEKSLVLVTWGKRSRSSPIIPIYEFVSDDAKAEALRLAYAEYLNK